MKKLLFLSLIIIAASSQAVFSKESARDTYVREYLESVKNLDIDRSERLDRTGKLSRVLNPGSLTAFYLLTAPFEFPEKLSTIEHTNAIAKMETFLKNKWN